MSFDMQYLERLSLWRVETLQNTFLWIAPKTKTNNIFDGQNGIWQVLKTSILNIATKCWSISKLLGLAPM